MTIWLSQRFISGKNRPSKKTRDTSWLLRQNASRILIYFIFVSIYLRGTHILLFKIINSNFAHKF